VRKCDFVLCRTSKKYNSNISQIMNQQISIEKKKRKLNLEEVKDGII
jgi:hypothetical protein